MRSFFIYQNILGLAYSINFIFLIFFTMPVFYIQVLQLIVELGICCVALM